jgi:ABC-type thiamine transport system ATPase subunit
VRIPAWMRAALLLAMTLASGIAVGVAYERHRAAAHQAVGMDAHGAMHHLARELDLDAAQQIAIARILARHQGEVDSTWHAVQPHVRATLESTMQEIAGVLRPDQLAKYRRMTEAHRPGHR